MSDRRIHFPVVLPGPRTGQTLCAAYLFERFQQAGWRCVHYPVLSRWGRGLPGASTLIKALTQWFAGLRVLCSPCVDQVYYCPNAGAGLGIDAVYMAIARWRGLHVLHHHSAAYIERPTMLGRLAFWMTPHSAVHLFSCQRLAEAFQQHYGERRVHLLPLAFMCDAPNADPSTGPSSERFRIGHLSNLSFSKGLREVLQLSQSLADKKVPHELVLGGGATSSDVSRAIEEAKAKNPSVRWLGPLYGDEKENFYRSLDLFLLPSRSETWGLVVTEAIAHGVPCVVTDVQCLPCQTPKGYAVNPAMEDWENQMLQIALQLQGKYARKPEAYAALRAQFRKRFDSLREQSFRQLDLLTETPVYE